MYKFVWLEIYNTMALRNVNSRRWCFTINNPSDADRVCLDALKDLSTYLVYQLEKGDLDTEHYQGYVEFLNRKRGTTVKNLIGSNPHIEAAKGSPTQASAYCKKDDSRLDGPWEYGELTQITQGSRTDLTTIKESIDSGKNLLEISGEYPATYMQYHAGIEKFYNMRVTPRVNKTQFIIFWGLTDQGKTHLANLFPNPYSVPKKTSTQFYDGYDPNFHHTIIFDDFKGGLEFRELLHLADKWPHQVNKKGSQIVWKPKYLIITSNYEPCLWYVKKARDDKCWPAFQRRIDLEVEFQGNNKLFIKKQVMSDDDMPESFTDCFDQYEFVEQQLDLVDMMIEHELVGNYDQQFHLGTVYN